MKIEWSDKLSVGFDLIDSQHKELIDRLNMLLSAMSEGRGRGRLDETIKFIEDYVVVHFETEEELMRKNLYPDYSLHRLEHQYLVVDFTTRKEELASGSPTSADVIKTYNWLTDWVANHIMQTDVKLGTFLKGKIQ